MPDQSFIELPARFNPPDFQVQNIPESHSVFPSSSAENKIQELNKEDPANPKNSYEFSLRTGTQKEVPGFLKPFTKPDNNGASLQFTISADKKIGINPDIRNPVPDGFTFRLIENPADPALSQLEVSQNGNVKGLFNAVDFKTQKLLLKGLLAVTGFDPVNLTISVSKDTGNNLPPNPSVIAQNQHEKPQNFIEQHIDSITNKQTLNKLQTAIPNLGMPTDKFPADGPAIEDSIHNPLPAPMHSPEILPVAPAPLKEIPPLSIQTSESADNEYLRSAYDLDLMLAGILYPEHKDSLSEASKNIPADKNKKCPPLINLFVRLAPLSLLLAGSNKEIPPPAPLPQETPVSGPSRLETPPYFLPFAHTNRLQPHPPEEPPAPSSADNLPQPNPPEQPQTPNLDTVEKGKYVDHYAQNFLVRIGIPELMKNKGLVETTPEWTKTWDTLTTVIRTVYGLDNNLSNPHLIMEGQKLNRPSVELSKNLISEYFNNPDLMLWETCRKTNRNSEGNFDENNYKLALAGIKSLTNKLTR